MQRGKRASRKLVDDVSKPASSVPQESEFYEGESLLRLLKSIQREIVSARSLHGDSLPEKLWFKVILLAADCNPRWLTKHLPGLALSRNVPVIFVKDEKGGSLRLGELVKLKTVIAVGIKAKGNTINQLMDKILHGDAIDLLKLPETASTLSLTCQLHATKQ